MECNFCHSQQAKIFLSQIFNGEIIKLDLCESCAKKLEVTDVQGVAVNELLEKINLIQEEGRYDAEQICSDCGMSLEEMKKKGQLGCALCYTSFSEEISGVIGDNQKGDHHYGKVPNQHEGEMAEFRTEQLRKRLQKAVAAEDFEVAARLRDELKQSPASE